MDNLKSTKKAKKELEKCKLEIEYLLKKYHCHIISADEYTPTLIQHKNHYLITDTI